MGLGIDYNDTSSPYYSTDKNQYGEGNLLPLVSVRGIDPFDETNGLFVKDKGLTAIQGGTNRFIINISPLKNETYPNSGSDKTLINLDTIQLYAPNPKIDYKFGKDYSAPYPDLDYPPYFSSKTVGVYASPVPIRGAPIEFRKVYFRGQLVDKDGGYVTGSGCDERSFQAVFACSKPIEQTIRDTGYHGGRPHIAPPSGALLNPRNENFAQSEYAIEREWEEIEILSCGSGSSGGGACSTLSVDMYTTENSGDYFVSGDKITGDSCNQFLAFSGDCVNQSYISGSSGDFSGYVGSLIEIKSSPLSVDMYTAGNSGDYFVSEDKITGDPCNQFLAFSGDCVNQSYISGSSGDFSGLVGSLIEIKSSPLSVDMYTAGNSGDYFVSGGKMTGDSCNQFLAFSGDCVNQSYISGSDGDFLGLAGSLIEIKGSKTLVDKYNPDKYEVSYSSTECNACEKLIVFSGDPMGITMDTIRATGGANSGACGNLITIDMNFETSGCLSTSTNTSTNTVTYGLDKSGVLECLGYQETGVRLITHTGDSTGCPTGFSDLFCCDFFMLVRCPTETEANDPSGFITGCCSPVSGACCAPDGTCSVIGQVDCEEEGGYYWGDGTECDDEALTVAGDAFPASITLEDLCATGVCCFFDVTKGPVVDGARQGEYECELDQTLRYYYETIRGDTDYQWDETDPRRISDFRGPIPPVNFSTFERLAGDDCSDCPPSPTTTTTGPPTTTTTTPPPATCCDSITVVDSNGEEDGREQVYIKSAIECSPPTTCEWVGQSFTNWTIEWDSAMTIWIFTEDGSEAIWADDTGGDCPTDAEWVGSSLTVTCTP